MRVKNRLAAVIFKVVLIIGCGYGLTEMSGLLKVGISSRMFAYYTNLSDIAALAFTMVSAVHTAVALIRQGNRQTADFLPWLKRALVLTISVTLLVYHFVLGPTMYRMNVNYEVYGCTDILIHYFTPIMFILDWILFDEKGKTRWFDPLLWLLLPVAYLVFVLIRAEVAEPLNAAGARYPYYFLDIDALGAKSVAGYVIICLAAFTALGYIVMALDNLPGFVLKRRKTGVEVLETKEIGTYINPAAKNAAKTSREAGITKK